MPEGQDATAPPAPPGDETTPAGDIGITVALDQFSGPMDLLLYLVRRAEVDIKDLPVTTIADQFAAWVSAAAGTTLDLEAAGDFVVMAATLLEIKARMVAPPPEGTEVADDGEDEFDPRAGLIRKLLVYRAAKEAAFDLDRREDQRRLRHHRGHKEVVPDDAAEVDAWELKEVSAGTLANLWFDLLKRIDSLGPRTVLADDLPMGVRMAQVVEDMRNRGEGRLSELFAIENGPVARVSIVMAVLECTRQRLLRVAQHAQYGDVHIRFRAEDDRAITAGDPGPAEVLPKRQRRPPLVTWDGKAPVEGEDGEDADEAPPENEEQRFLRDLETSVGVERLLSRAADLEKGFISWWEETHPGEPLPPGVVKPEPPPPPPSPAAPVVEAKPEAPPRPKRQPKPPAHPAEAAAAAVPTAPAAVADKPASEPPPIPDAPAAVIAAVPDPQPAAIQPIPDPQTGAAASPPDLVPVISTAPAFAVVPLAEPAPAPPAPVDAAVAPDPEARVAPVAALDTQTTEPAEPTGDQLPGPRALARDEASPEPEIQQAEKDAPASGADPVSSVEPQATGDQLPGPWASARDEASPEPEIQQAEKVQPSSIASVEPTATGVAPAVAPAVLVAPAPITDATPLTAPSPTVEVAPARAEARAPEEPPPDPTPPPPPPTTANTPPTPASTTPNQPSKPTPMPLPRHLKLAAMIALWVAITGVLVAWAWNPRDLLTASGPHDAVVARDSELAWTLNLALDREDPESWLLPTATPALGTFSWRDERTCVFKPTGGALPPGTTVDIAFNAKLRAYGGFRFPEQAVPAFRVSTLPALSVSGSSATLPAFGDGRIELVLNRVPSDATSLLAAVAVSPAVPLHKAVVEGRLRLSGPFVPGTTYALTVADTVAGPADERPVAWQGNVTMPPRTPGARLAAGVGRQAAIEAMNLPFLVVENAAGMRETLRFAPAVGDVPARAELPGWLLSAGENRLRLRWSGGEGEAILTRHDLRLTPEDGAPALLGGSLPVVSAH